MTDTVYPYYRIRVVIEKCTAAGDGLVFAKETNAIRSTVTTTKDKQTALDIQYRVKETYQESQS